MAANSTLTIFTINNLSQIELIRQLQDWKAIPKSIRCSECGGSMSIATNKQSIDDFHWYCGNNVYKPKKKPRRCSYRSTLRNTTFFAHSHLTLKQIVLFAHMWMANLPLKFIANELGLANQTATNWASLCREVTYDDAVVNASPIGGEGIVVEIDESKFGRRKYNKGHHVEGQWVFGGIERHTGHCFMVPVEKRDAATLLAIIKVWILPGSTVISDYWRAYNCLTDHGYRHLTVNHKLTFKDKETGACTNSIEASWRHAKAIFPSSNRQPQFFAGYLSKYMFLKMLRKTGVHPTAAFFRAAGTLYPGQSSTADETEPSLNDVATVHTADHSQLSELDEIFA